MTRPAQPWLLSHNNGLKFSFIVSTYYNSGKSELFELSDRSETPPKSLSASHLSSVLCFLHSTVPTCFWKYLTRMALPIDYLWKGLKKLESQHQGRKEKLLAELKAKKTISEDDQEWLDGAANFVDEECIIEALESEADYESAMRTLSASNQVIFDKLMKLASGGDGENGRKWKCECVWQ